MGEAAAAEESTVEGSTSALKASQAAKRENSYYYAHYATPDAPVPEPKRLATRKATVEQTVTLENYMLEDGDKKVKVHIPVKGLAEMPEGAVVVHFREQSFDLRVYAQDGVIYGLNVAVLNEKIVKEDCKVLRKKEKVFLVLKKPEGSYSWDTVHK